MSDPLALLTGPDAGGLLAAGVGGAGGEVLDWSVSTVQHQSGAATTAVYRVTVRWPHRVAQETLVAAAGPGSAPEQAPGVVVLEDGRDRVRLWRFPSDPLLPGLAVATDPTRLAGVLAELGVPRAPGADGSVHVRVRTYRPCRRAVVQVIDRDRRERYVRVVRPSVVRSLHERHVLLHDAGVPVPRSHGWTPDGLLVLEAIPGPTLRHHLRTGRPVPTGTALLAMLDRLPEAVRALPLRRSWADEAQHYAAVVGGPLPRERERAEQLAAAVASGLAGLEPDAATHGDFHDDQVIMQGQRIRGLLDVDTAGPGRRADDVATLLAHLEASILGGAGHPQRLRAQVEQWQGAAERRLDAREVRLRVAGVLLSLATGPFRIQQQGWARATTLHLDAVQRWVESAGHLRG
ncbi:MAG: aminoglycoside phosphotransferase family protein [Candidatus Nanopelagicales bacterium]|nr:aminoglycoside phosphotransferase family protein [Candidatus Nanopelagicales bacterium]